MQAAIWEHARGRVYRPFHIPRYGAEFTKQIQLTRNNVGS